MVEELTADERYLIDVYRALNADGKQRMKDEAYILSQIPKYQQRNEQISKEIIGVSFDQAARK